MSTKSLSQKLPDPSSAKINPKKKKKKQILFSPGTLGFPEDWLQLLRVCRASQHKHQTLAFLGKLYGCQCTQQGWVMLWGAGKQLCGSWLWCFLPYGELKHHCLEMTKARVTMVVESIAGSKQVTRERFILNTYTNNFVWYYELSYVFI